jgi:uncharacterized protein (DUF2249 family)
MKESENNLQISPEMKIGVLLDKFPGLEKTLLEMAPEFKKLRNPILRKTIARVTSLRQASAVAKIPLAEMINRLRSEAGIREEFMSDDVIGSFSKEIPAWFSRARIVQSLDARPLLERGEQPIHRVFSESKSLKAGEIYELITSFLPAPLIDAAKEKGYLTWSKNEGEKVFKTYLTPQT